MFWRFRAGFCRMLLGAAVLVLASTPDSGESAEAELPADARGLNWSEIVRDLVVHLVPENYVHEKHWGQTEKVISGVRVRTKGGHVRIERREKKVNHGFWRRVKFKLLNPEKTLKLEFRNVEEDQDGGTRFDLFLQLRGRCETQFALWTTGLKGLNGSVESDVTLQLIAKCSFRIDAVAKPGAYLPEVYLRPQVHDLDLNLTDVDARQIGAIGGWVADELGNFTRKAVEDLLRSQEPELLKRVQKAIRKKEDRLRIDLNDWRKFLDGKSGAEILLE